MVAAKKHNLLVSFLLGCCSRLPVHISLQSSSWSAWLMILTWHFFFLDPLDYRLLLRLLGIVVILTCVFLLDDKTLMGKITCRTVSLMVGCCHFGLLNMSPTLLSFHRDFLCQIIGKNNLGSYLKPFYSWLLRS